jgi:acetyl-CoA carboxylase carboxyl transferase subunit alpha
MSRLRVPIVCAIIGEGGSGGALALGVADRVLMLENAIYSVASPEAAASILWKDAGNAALAAEAMKITAPDLLGFGIVDAIVPEPPGGAHTDHPAAAAALREALVEQLSELDALPLEQLLANRTQRYRAIGAYVS